jgi:hypothetical protein
MPQEILVAITFPMALETQGTTPGMEATLTTLVITFPTALEIQETTRGMEATLTMLATVLIRVTMRLLETTLVNRIMLLLGRMSTHPIMARIAGLTMVVAAIWETAAALWAAIAAVLTWVATTEPTSIVDASEIYWVPCWKNRDISDDLTWPKLVSSTKEVPQKIDFIID